MPTTAPYIPAPDAAFDGWFTNFSTKLTASPTTYGLVAGDATAVAALQVTWAAAYLAAITPASRTPVTVAAKNVARVNATLVLRPYAQRIAVNPSVSNANKVAIGVTPRGTVPTPVPAPGTFPLVSLVRATPGVLRIETKDSGSVVGKAKPDGAIACQIYVGYGPTSPVPVQDCKFVNAYTKSPFDINTAGHAGEFATIFGRWVTRSGPAGVAQVGPWSAQLFTAVI